MLTPFAEDGRVDAGRLSCHAAAVLARGAGGVTLFGTTGEGASIGQAERARVIAALGADGVPMDRITLGLCATAAEDAARQAREGAGAGIGTFLLLPPFYFADATEAGLFDWHAAVLAATPPQCRFILYHIPQVSRVAIAAGLLARLDHAFPSRIRAIKDSSGDWAASEAFLSLGGPDVLIGDERHLHRAVAKGGAGAISGIANLHPERLGRIVATGSEDPVISSLADAVTAVPVIAALKAIMAETSGDPVWERLAPPLTSLAPGDRAALLAHAMGQAGG